MNWVMFFNVLGLFSVLGLIAFLSAKNPFVGVLFFVLILATALGLLTAQAHADDFVLRYASSSNITAKSLSVGQIYNTYGALNIKLEGGALWDTRTTNGTDPFGSLAFGITPSAGPLFFEFYQGFAYFTNPDGIFLSSNFNFNEDFGIGFRGKRDEALVLGFRHFSNAGLVPPNNGIDMFNLSVRLPL